MPSVFDIAKDIQNTLNQVQTNTQNSVAEEAAIKTDTGDIRNSVHSLITIDQTGFVSLSNGLAAIIDQQKVTNTLLDFERRQNDTIICWLANIASELCRSLRTQEQQLKMQVSIDDSIREVKEVLEIVHGAAAIQVIRRHELESQIHACCPPRQDDPGPCFEACSKPDYQPYKPRVPDYHPLGQSSPTRDVQGD